ncbi:hypothetical protein KEM54_003267 [Ascosphaera aggregata]|nr:hypothetical protein KEM54_003267 [Ascosphaera aggregata]
MDWASYGETPPSGTSIAADSAQQNAPVAGSGIKTRSKRNRYISLACNECKRRKINVNVVGILVFNVQLVTVQGPEDRNYARTDSAILQAFTLKTAATSKILSKEFRSMKGKIESLQNQINALYSSVEELYQRKQTCSTSVVAAEVQSNNEAPPLSENQAVSSLKKPQLHPEDHALDTQSKKPRFHGPTSNAFNLDVARTSLQSMGIASGGDINQPQELETVPKPPLLTLLPPFPHLLAHPTKDPLWSVNRQEALRLLASYDEQVNMMYPLLDLQKFTDHINLIYTFLESAEKAGLTMRYLPGSDKLDDDDTCILKMVFAVTLMIENHGESPLARRFYAAIKGRLQDKIVESADFKAIQLGTLCSIYHFVSDDDLMAYRAIGLAARMCLEMGLHRVEGLARASSNEQEMRTATKLFWTIYTLDRRWSFGTGLPFVLQDDDITVSEPEDSVPSLRVMVPFYRIGSKIWYSGVGVDGVLKRDNIEFLDYQLLQWIKTLPPEFRYDPHQPTEADVPKCILRSRLITYIRANHMRMLIYRPILHSPQSILSNMAWSQTVVDLAKDTIRVLTRITQESDIYHSIQVLFNYFLLASLAVLLLAASHAPDRFNAQVRDEFFMALNLVKNFSAKSSVSKRLWKTIRHLHKIGQRLGLLGSGHIVSENHDDRQAVIAAVPASTEYAGDAHTDAAVAIAGMTHHDQMTHSPSTYNPIQQVGGTNPVFVAPTVAQPHDPSPAPMNPGEIGSELLNFFETMGGYGGFQLSDLSSATGEENSSSTLSRLAHNLGNVDRLGDLGSEEDLSMIMRDAF